MTELGKIPDGCSDDDIDLALARINFWDYRKRINPGMKIGWFQADVAARLQNFYNRLLNGERPVLVISAPPQHGKTAQIVDFITWVLGKNSDLKTIYASFSDRLGVRSNLQLQRVMSGQRYSNIFPETRLPSSDEKQRGLYTRTRELVEIMDAQGSFRNTTVRGSVTGEQLDLGIVDDPIKGREAAKSETIRNHAWEWFTDDFFTRFSENAGLLFILTRWHIDDPIGRLRDIYDDVEVLNYPALADPGVIIMNDDPREPDSGQPLFPELKSEDFLRIRKSVLRNSSWESLYQGAPYVEGGEMFPVENFQIVDAVPELKGRPVRYWDKAGTQGGGAYTAGVKMAKTKKGQWIVLDVVRGQWSAGNREARMKQVAQIDGNNTQIWIEQEPGSGGKESAENTIANMEGYDVHADSVSGKGSKEIRAEPYAAQVEGGNVLILSAEWNKNFIDEHESFPNGKYLDQVDAAAGAFIKLSQVKDYGYTEKQMKQAQRKEKTTFSPSLEEKAW